MGSGLMGTMAQGMAFGAGSEIAHQGIRAMMGGGSHGHAPAQEQAQQPMEYAQPMQQQPAYQQDNGPCAAFKTNLMTCLNQSNGGDVCQNYMDMLTQCQRDNTPSTNYYQ